MLELLVVIIIISLLLAIAIDRLMKVQVVAERASMETIIGHLQSAISLTIGEHVAQDRIPELNRYIDSNPMLLLADTPVNYAGSFDKPPQNIEKGIWWFEQDTKTLVYRVGNPEYFEVSNSEKGLVKFKIQPVYDDKNRNGKFDRDDKLVGLKLAPLYKYRWSNEPLNPAELTRGTPN